ncbi:DUF896 domain-containing protein [Oribacterium sp. FC2011]|uniref:DUF896 domain-containing protein n=1 Tax=Oribacterium sp. FC2011 TaxID=1408311 RepID=UPI0009E07648|nr:DUF896 domain-containing protein [Oribacterium sp. FC2011]
MITEKEIARINELYHKSKEGGGLTAEEKDEQAKLRRAYIDSVKANLGVYLKDIKNASEDTSASGDVKERVQKAMEKTDAELAGEDKSAANSGNPEISSHLHI